MNDMDFRAITEVITTSIGQLADSALAGTIARIDAVAGQRYSHIVRLHLSEDASRGADGDVIEITFRKLRARKDKAPELSLRKRAVRAEPRRPVVTSWTPGQEPVATVIDP